jgi:hypothetical protein
MRNAGNDTLNNYTTRDESGLAAVWHVANEAGDPHIKASPPPQAVADFRMVDAALRALAASEAPDAIELRRMREAALRTTRLHAVEAMNRKTLSPPARHRTIPKWPIAAAAAAVVAVGFFTWVANSAPSGTSRTFATKVGNEGEDRRASFLAEIEEYRQLVTAFTPVELPTDAAAESLDDLDSQVDALSVLGSGQMPEEN